MPKRTDISSILLIGSGPIIIGQGAEFDYSGTQAVRALKKKGYTIVMVEQNFRFAAPLADRHYVVERGKVVEIVRKDELENRREVGLIVTNPAVARGILKVFESDWVESGGKSAKAKDAA